MKDPENTSGRLVTGGPTGTESWGLTAEVGRSQDHADSEPGRAPPSACDRRLVRSASWWFVPV